MSEYAIPEVGPVLQSDRVGQGVAEAIRRMNDGTKVIDQGSYLRVCVPRRCAVTRAAIEDVLHESFRLPGDLEAVMPSFKGRLKVSEDEVSWTAPEKGVR